jgi:hypothetical protein
MQVLILLDIPVLNLFTISASAKKGRAIEIISAWLLSNIRCIVDGSFTRFDAMIGIPGVFSLIRLAVDAQAPLGTSWLIVGIRDSCHPIPIFKAETFSSLRVFASKITSSNVGFPGIKSIPDIRNITGNPSGRFFLTERNTSIDIFILRFASPPK